MITIKNLSTLYVGTYKLTLKYNIRQYYEFRNVFITREEDDSGKGYLYAYGYYEMNYNILWEISDKDVFAIYPIVPELKKKEEFITPEHYRKYIEEYKGKELLEVCVSNWPYDDRYVVDANTGEIYSRMKSK